MPGISGLITKQVTKSTPHKPVIPKIPPVISQDTPISLPKLPPAPDRTHITGPAGKYSPELATKILIAIRTSDDCVDHVLTQCGVGRHTWYDWVERYPELGEEYDLALRSKARAEVERRETQWNETVDKILDTPDPDPKTLQTVDTQSRALDRRCRYTQWRAQVHNPARYAPRALLGVQALDPTALMSQGQAWRDPSQAIEQQQDTTTQAPGPSLDNSTPPNPT